MNRKTLREEIREFQSHKQKLIPILIVVGLLGLVLPIIPGVAVLFLAFMLLFPKHGEQLLKRIRQTIKI